MGYMAQWIEFVYKKSSSKKLRPTSTATFKRQLPGLQEAGLYLDSKKGQTTTGARTRNDFLKNRSLLNSQMQSRKSSKAPSLNYRSGV